LSTAELHHLPTGGGSWPHHWREALRSLHGKLIALLHPATGHSPLPPSVPLSVGEPSVRITRVSVRIVPATAAAAVFIRR